MRSGISIRTKAARRLVSVAGALLLGLCGLIPAAAAQQLPPAAALGDASPGVSLRLTVEQTRLIVQVLGQVGCQNVTQLIVCEDAAALLKEIRTQAASEVK